MADLTEISKENELNKNKRKWQIALRRYLIERKPSSYYAPFFGLTVNLFRNWIEIQFEENNSWVNFGREWKFEHLIPSEYFDLNNTDDLKLYWNFLNIRVEPTNSTTKVKSNILAAIVHFEQIFQKTGLDKAMEMVEKLKSHANINTEQPGVFSFLERNSGTLKVISNLNSEMLLRLNQGEELESLILEQEILSKFGR